MSIKLSLCIPTYNRASFIGQTLESIVSQATDEVEIVVSDNASTDNTQQIVDSFQERFPRITYFRWDQNMGADRNYLKVIELAQGEYCWFMGSDDQVEKGGIKKILEALKENSGLAGISVNCNAYDSELIVKIPSRPVAGGVFKNDTLLKTQVEAASLLGDYYGYLPGQIVNRILWNQVVSENNLEPYFNAYVHVFVILSMLKKTPRWLYVNQPCVGWRSGNDSFLSEGIFKRLAIDVQGYEKIARDTLGVSNTAYRDWICTVATVHVRYAILGAKLNSAPIAFFWKAFRLCAKTYWSFPAFWIKTFPFFLLPSFILRSVRAVYRATLKRYRLNQLAGM